jgi:Raf kinase inhibitor-like YbhB/YbcL family protein
MSGCYLSWAFAPILSNIRRLRASPQPMLDGIKILLVGAVLVALRPVCSLADQNAPTATISLNLPALSQNGTVARRYTCDGQDISPDVVWSGIPVSAKTLVLIADDPDAPSGVFTHWVVFNLPTNISGLPENLPRTPTLALGGEQAANDFGRIGYNGPCPPPGSAHHYHFKLYALSTTLRLATNADARKLVAAMRGHVLARGEVVATYGR